MILTVSILLFMAASTGIALVLSVLTGSLTLVNAVAAITGGLLMGGMTWKRLRGFNSELSRPGFFDQLMILCFSLFSLRQFLWIYFEKGNEIFTLNSRHNYSDLPMHLTYISGFVNGMKFWPGNPLFVGETLTYHFGIDLFTALFVKLGVPLTHALPLIGIAAAALTLTVLYGWSRGFAIGSFLFSGGAAGYLFLLTGVFDDYQADIAWKSIPLTLFIPQRGFLYAFPAGLILLWSWRRKFIDSKEGLPAYVEGLLWGMMPIFQANTFVFLSVTFLFWSVLSRKVSQALPVYYWAVIPATFLMLKITNNFQRASMMWLKPGWMINDQNPLAFFWTNFGFYFPLAAAVFYLILRRKDIKTLLFLSPGIFMFAVSFFVMFLPNEWDNVKIIVWSYLLLVPVMDQLIISKLPAVLRMPLLAALFFSGFICVMSLTGRWHQGAGLMDREEFDGVCFALKDIPADVRIATAQDFKHPVAVCGHSLVAGWNGHIWVHGIQPKYVEGQLRRIMMGEFDWKQIAAGFKARYLFWGPREQKAFEGSGQPWLFESFKVVEGTWGALYDIQKPSQLKMALTKMEPSAGGLKVRYYPNDSWSGTPMKELESGPVQFEWDDKNRLVPAPFSVVYEGKIYIPETGKTTFYLASDDGSRLEIDGETVIDNGGVHALRVRSHEKHFEQGWHDIKIDYQDIGGGSALQFWWRRPSGVEENVSGNYLEPGSTEGKRS